MHKTTIKTQSLITVRQGLVFQVDIIIITNVLICNERRTINIFNFNFLMVTKRYKRTVLFERKLFATFGKHKLLRLS